MLGCGLGGLRGRGEVNETIAQVDGRAKGFALGLQGRPFIGAEDFIDQHEGLMPCSAFGIKCQATRACAVTYEAACAGETCARWGRCREGAGALR